MAARYSKQYAHRVDLEPTGAEKLSSTSTANKGSSEWVGASFQVNPSFGRQLGQYVTSTSLSLARFRGSVQWGQFARGPESSCGRLNSTQPGFDMAHRKTEMVLASFIKSPPQTLHLGMFPPPWFPSPLEPLHCLLASPTTSYEACSSSARPWHGGHGRRHDLGHFGPALSGAHYRKSRSGCRR